MFYSEEARRFVEKWGNAPEAVDTYGRNLVAHLAGWSTRGRDKRNLVSMQSAILHGYKPDVDGEIWQSALHEAADLRHWAMVEAMLRFNISRSHILLALGTLLSQSPLLDASRCRARDDHRNALLLFQRLNGATQEECRYLLSKALIGSAMGWFLPLMQNGVSLPPMEEWHGWDEGGDDLWWYCNDAAPEGKGIFARLMRRFFSERLPKLQQADCVLFPDFEVREGRLYFTGNPAAKLPLLSRRRHRHRMKDIERAALLFAK